MKNKKTFLKIGLVLLGLTAVIGAGFFLTGSVVFARNAIALALLGGAGVGIATPVVNAAKKFFASRATNKEEKMRNKIRDNERELEQIQNLEQVPVNENTVKINASQNSSVKKNTTKNKTK